MNGGVGNMLRIVDCPRVVEAEVRVWNALEGSGWTKVAGGDVRCRKEDGRCRSRNHGHSLGLSCD